MIYTFDKLNVKYRKVTGKAVLISIIGGLLASLLMSIFIIKMINDGTIISNETRAIILKESNKANEFSPEKLRAYILELNIKYPHIVMAQAIIETGNFSSTIFKDNHNLFGMKVATIRPTTNKGTENGHAYYNNWKDCVVDYAFYQAAYLRDIKTEREYLEYLQQYYAEDSSYVTKVKSECRKMQLYSK